MANFSHTHVAANASFSICVYWDSVHVIEREAYATGCHWPWTFCSRTASKPWEEASAEMAVSAVGSYSVRMLGAVSSFLRLVEVLSCAGVHSQAFFELNSSHNGLDNSATYAWREFAKLVYQGICRVLKLISVFPSVVWQQFCWGQQLCLSDQWYVPGT